MVGGGGGSRLGLSYILYMLGIWHWIKILFSVLVHTLIQFLPLSIGAWLQVDPGNHPADRPRGWPPDARGQGVKPGRAPQEDSHPLHAVRQDADVQRRGRQTPQGLFLPLLDTGASEGSEQTKQWLAPPMLCLLRAFRRPCLDTCFWIQEKVRGMSWLIDRTRDSHPRDARYESLCHGSCALRQGTLSSLHCATEDLEPLVPWLPGA